MIKGCKYYHGYDGLGDCPDEEAPDLSIIKKEDGVDTLIQLSKEYTGEWKMDKTETLATLGTHDTWRRLPKQNKLYFYVATIWRIFGDLIF